MLILCGCLLSQFGIWVVCLEFFKLQQRLIEPWPPLVTPLCVSYCTGNNDFSLQELEEISREVGKDWEKLGVYLHVSDHTTQDIKHRNEDVSVCAFRCLWAWYEAGEDVTRRTLAEALRKINKGRLASRICS